MEVGEHVLKQYEVVFILTFMGRVFTLSEGQIAAWVRYEDQTLRNDSAP